MSLWSVAFVAGWLGIGLPTDPVYAFVWIWAGTVAWNSARPWRSHLRFARDWVPVVLLLVLYNLSRGFAYHDGDGPARVRVDRGGPVDVRLGHRTARCRRSGCSSTSTSPRCAGGTSWRVGCTSRTSWRRWPPRRCSGCASAAGGRPSCAVGASSAPPAWSPTSSTRPRRRGGRRRTVCWRRSPGSPPGGGRRSACTAPATCSTPDSWPRTRWPRCRRCTPRSRCSWCCFS